MRSGRSVDWPCSASSHEKRREDTMWLGHVVSLLALNGRAQSRLNRQLRNGMPKQPRAYLVYSCICKTKSTSCNGISCGSLAQKWPRLWNGQATMRLGNSVAWNVVHPAVRLTQRPYVGHKLARSCSAPSRLVHTRANDGGHQWAWPCSVFVRDKSLSAQSCSSRQLRNGVQK